MSVAPDPSNHPRLFFSRDGIPELRRKAEQGTPKWMRDRLIARCNRLLKTSKLDGRRWAKVTGQKPSWNNARDILDLSLGYVIAGNAAHRDLAIAALMKVCEWPTWYIGYEPNRAVVLQAAAMAYDWLHEELGPARARKVAAKIAFECEAMSKFLTGNGRGSIGQSSSMAPRTYAPFGVAAIALKGECPKADEWLALARESVPRWVDGAIDDDGAFYYSSEACYNTLALNYVLGFYIAYLRLTGENLADTPKLRKNVLYQLYRLEPQRDGQGQFCVYGRGGAGCPQNMVGLAALLDDGLGRWYYEYVHGPHGLSAKGNVFSAEDRVAPLLWWKDVAIEHPDSSRRLGRAMHFRGSGKLVLRTGFESVEDIHLALECGPPKQGHSQADVGNFILNACGERFIDDPGTSGSYAWGMSAGAHNLVLIDNVGPAVRGHGTIGAFIHTDFADYLVADQKPAYDAQSPVQRARRHVLFVRPSYFVVVDDVKKDDQPHRYELVLHTTRERRAKFGDQTIVADGGGFTMRGEKADMRISFASPQNPRVKLPTAELIAEYLKSADASRRAQGDNKKFLASLQDAVNLPPLFRFGGPKAEKQGLFFTLLYPVEHGAPAPKAIPIENADLIAMSVNHQDIIGFNRGDEAVTQGDCTTDAKLFYARAQKGKCMEYLAASATTFRHRGVGFRADERITAAFKAARGKVTTAKATSLTLHCPGIQGIQVGGKPATLKQRSADQATIHLKPGEHDLRVVTAEEPSLGVVSRKVLSTHGSNQGTAYTMSNRIITANGKMFVAWLDHVADIVIQTCDLETGTWGKRVLLGKGVDNHSAPAITMDSEGTLYAMFGPHNGPFQFRQSARPCDATEWGPIEHFGSNGTYPSLVCGPDDTLHCAYRGGEKPPLRLIYHRRPKGGKWSEPREIVRAAAPSGYTQYTNALAISADNTLHLAFHIYDLHPPGGKAVGYLRSRDGGETWETAAGKRMALPVTPPSPCFIEQGPKLDMRCSNVALDPDGRPYLIAWHQKPAPMSARLWHHDGSAWKAVDLLPVVREVYPGQEIAWLGTLTFDRDGRLYIATVIQQPPFSWGDPSQEVILLTSDDRGKTFDVLPISKPDPELANWFPSIERPFGPRPIGVPALIYCHSRPRDKKTKVTCPGEIVFARLGED